MNQKKQKADKKVIILGDVNVGKTCLIRRYIDGVFVDNTENTIGVDFFLKKWNGKNIVLWDTAGQEEFQGLTSFYCRNANAAILCYDVCNKFTFDAIENRHARLLESVAENCLMVFVGTKSDLINKKKQGKLCQRDVTADEVMELSQIYMKRFESVTHPSGMLPIFETSSKLGENVIDVFEYIFETLVPESASDKEEENPRKLAELTEVRSNDIKLSRKCCR